VERLNTIGRGWGLKIKVGPWEAQPPCTPSL